MSVVISGALIDGAGIPMSGCHIILKSRVNTSEVVMCTKADVVTGNNGEYSFEAQVGKYCVYLRQDWHDEYCVGDIAVYDDSKPGTLNDFLTALDEGDLKPDVVKRFEEMVAQAQQSAEAAAKSERQTGQHVADAQQIKSYCETLADNVQQSAESVAASKQHVEQLASEVEQNAGQVQQGVQNVTDAVKKAQQAAKDSATSAAGSKNNADNAALSEQNAQKHAQKAEQHEQQTKQYAQDAATAAESAENAKGEIDDILDGGYLKIKNNLQEIVDAGPSALAEAQLNLQIRGVAGKSPVSHPFQWYKGTSIRNTLATAGAFGFGYTYEDQDMGRVDFHEGYTVSRWLKYATPGRYLVTASNGEFLVPNANTSGIIDVLWHNRSANTDATKVNKIAIFYSDTGGHIYTTNMDSLSDKVYWKRRGFSDEEVRSMLYSYVNYDWGDPDIGGLILAAYQGTADGDKNIKVVRRQVYPGSRLGPVGIECSFNPSGTYESTPRFYVVGCNSHSLPGSYIAMSGTMLTYSDKSFIALFMRIS
ncbi:prophage tail fiber N-terminal domain-containing protein [Escherichia coli]|nr:prophage tail fiber N-terminal domain-containing protein [Escherichia coli]